MNVNYCEFEWKFAGLNTDFGRELAQLWFGLDNYMIESLVGRYTRGKRKGQLRGSIRWQKATRGGWSRGKGVVLPGTVRRAAIVDSFNGNTIFESEP